MMGSYYNSFCGITGKNVFEEDQYICRGLGVALTFLRRFAPGVQEPLRIKNHQGCLIVKRNFYRPRAAILRPERNVFIIKGVKPALLICEVFPSSFSSSKPIVITWYKDSLGVQIFDPINLGLDYFFSNSPALFMGPWHTFWEIGRAHV